jgi:hypothetical protein
VPIPEARLREVQLRREVPTRFIHYVQDLMDAPAESKDREDTDSTRVGFSPRVRRVLDLPGVRNLLAYLLGVGLWRVRVRNP